MNNEQPKKDEEERQDSFLNLLIGIDSGVMAFFLIVRGDKLGEGVNPFQLAYYPFKKQVVILAGCVLCVLVLRGVNLFLHDKTCFRKFSKLVAAVVLLASVVAIIWGAVILNQNPDLLPGGNN